MHTVQITADDFGLSEGVNEAVERAHRDGVLNAASLMVAGPAAADAVRRARRLPGLRVGLHLVAVEGPAVLPPSQIPGLVGPDGWFPSDAVRLGFRYAFLPGVRRQLASEIQAQFAAFAATGLALRHADAHKHMHLHPVVGALLIRAGLAHGLRRIRIPNEPASVLGRCGHRPGAKQRLGAAALRGWTRLLRRQVRRAGLQANDAVFGIAWTGRMTTDRLLCLARHLPPGDVEIYTHPASDRNALLTRYMPGYDHAGELAALLDPRVRQSLHRSER